MASRLGWQVALAVGIVSYALISGSPEPAPAASRPWHLPLLHTATTDITRAFDLAVSPDGSGFVRGHRGVDFPAVEGDEVRAVGDGVVYFSGVISGKPTISIDHGDQLKVFGFRVRSTYEPVESRLAIGQRVSRGQVIGNVSEGNSHCSGTCLHFGLKVDKDRYVNPELLWVVSPSLLPSARG